jgi:hypothetical protein
MSILLDRWVGYGFHKRLPLIVLSILPIGEPFVSSDPAQPPADFQGGEECGADSPVTSWMRSGLLLRR